MNKLIFPFISAIILIICVVTTGFISYKSGFSTGTVSTQRIIFINCVSQISFASGERAAVFCDNIVGGVQ